MYVCVWRDTARERVRRHGRLAANSAEFLAEYDNIEILLVQTANKW